MSKISLAVFLREPKEALWYAEINKHGWTGPDGSSCSTDKIHGVMIGATSKSWSLADLPANLHDWRYHIIRRLGLPEVYRKAADLGYYVGCLERCERSLGGWRMWSARRRCKARYTILRLGAAWAAAGPLHRLKLGGFDGREGRTQT